MRTNENAPPPLLAALASARPRTLAVSGIGLLAVALIVALTLVASARAAQAPVPLLTAAASAVVAATTITNDGAGTTIVGDVTLSPGTAVTGLLASQVTGTIHADPVSAPKFHDSDPAAHGQVKADLVAAYDIAESAPTTAAVAGGVLTGTLAPGVYKATGFTLALPGAITLDGGNNADAVWIFQATSDLVTASSSSVNLVNGAQACNVFWQVTSSATLGSSSLMVGTILALTSITVDDSVTVRGRLLARNGTVTLINDTITKPSTCIKQADVYTAPADVGVVKTASPRSVSIGDNVTYTSVVTNHGPGVATGVTFGDTLPAGETLVSVTTTQGSCSGTTTITCAIGTLDVGKLATVVMVVKTTAVGTITNTARIGAQQADQNVGANNTSAAVVEVAALVPKAQVKPKPKAQVKPKPKAQVKPKPKAQVKPKAQPKPKPAKKGKVPGFTG